MRKKRAYDSTLRQENAERTRATILDAARTLFCAKGFAATTMGAIAEEAGVALDTVYASVGKKPALFRLLIESAISGRAEAVPAAERDYVRRIEEEETAKGKLALYAAAVRAIQPRLAPLVRVLGAASTADPDLGAMWKEISDRRAKNMRLFARSLQSTGELRRDLDLDEIADVLWSTNGPEYYWLLVEERGWSLDRFEAWLADAWARLLLEYPARP